MDPIPIHDDRTISAKDARGLLDPINLLPDNQLQVVLEKVKVALNMYVSPAVLREACIEQRYDPIAKAVMAHFELWLMSNTVHKETEVACVPETWWDGFKESCFPQFLKRKFPPKHRQIFTETKFVHVCPHLNIATPKEERYHLQFLTPPGDLNRLQR